MSNLNPYVHSCVEHPRLPCPACCWAEEHQPDVLVCDECTVVLFRPVCDEFAFIVEVKR